MSIKESILKQSDRVQSEKSRKDRKDKGVFYTPPEIVERMTERVLSELDLSANPYIRVLDLACGSGLFLVKAFQVLKDKFEKNYEVILARNKGLEEVLQKDGIDCFIIENNLWGADIDQKALDTAGEILTKLAGKKCRLNLRLCDSLLDVKEGEYDYILGNPPYIGHKQVSGEYKKVLQQLYKGIYRDKSDISYCFLKKGIDLLKEGGSLSFITSRYFMEGPSASGLRNYITDRCTVTEVIDFYGQTVFQEAGVAACIITLRKGSYGTVTSVLKHKQGAKSSAAELFDLSSFERFNVNRAVLKNEGWVFLSPEKHEIFSYLEAKGSLTLGDIARNCQGIITGCDRAFIVDKNEISAYGIEESLLKPWIKNSSIFKYDIKAVAKFLIYSDFIESEGDFPNAIKYISSFRDRLIKRRECRRGVRKWYQLQWGRTNEVFDTPKIVYPYKSADSRFAVDEAGYYHSADIYNLRLKNEYEKAFSLDYIAAILNSRLFEFYFKCYAKKISEDLYDYYPNTVLRMKIPMPEGGSSIRDMALELRNCKNEDSKNTVIYEIDRAVYKLYGLNEKQIALIEKDSNKYKG